MQRRSTAGGAPLLARYEFWQCFSQQISCATHACTRKVDPTWKNGVAAAIGNDRQHEIYVEGDASSDSVLRRPMGRLL